MVALLGPDAGMPTAGAQQTAAARRYLYVGVPGSDNDAAGPLGILVFDIGNNHKLIRRIPVEPSAGARAKTDGGDRATGIVADAKRQRLYLSATSGLKAFDLATGRVLWETSYAGGCCDRLDLSPDGATLYVPALGAPKWYAIDTAGGRLLATVDVQGFPRQTIFGRDGNRVFLGAWESRIIWAVDPKTHKVVREVGPFEDSVCPFTVNGRGSLAFVNVDGLVGFDVADLQTGSVLDRVIVADSDVEAWSRYECPSHGIALTRDERELWVADGVANRLHVFDATTYPPVPSRTIGLTAQPRWVAFGANDRYVYPSTGDVIDAASGKIVAVLEDERGSVVHSQTMVEIGEE